jgi:D-3-phosphoglycerate dehydrogenase
MGAESHRCGGAVKPTWTARCAAHTVPRFAEEAPMSETVDALLCDLLAWLVQGAQPYGDVMEAWRTSCPRLPVWEDANDRGFIEHVRMDRHAMVRITPAGLAFLARRR